ncbi:MAG: hydantoinase/oxoprolinase family protein [Bifidobacteriaceae bacterium]|nr:hydantoinase/oxoprolinase family protein [Bifidobacteriaceae bacterium]
MSATGTASLKVAVDIGGTFVDAIAYSPQTGEIKVHKVPTTPEAPEKGVMASVLGVVDDLSQVESLAHGTTLGLNAILQRNGADVGIITTKGFADILEIARAAIGFDHMYDFQYAKPAPLVPRRHRLGVPERLDYRGNELEPLDQAALIEAGHYLVDTCGLKSLAVCFLHSYANPAHERAAARLLRAEFPGVEVSISSELTREYREYERTSTVALDAYIRPILNNYLAALEGELALAGFTKPLHIMRSGGGAMTAELAKQAPMTTVLSGPAGGVVGATFLARELDLPAVLSFDVGGTSVDACVIVNGQPSEVHEAEIDGLPLLVPIFDIRTIGAGGGSIAWMDGDIMKVGPRSAGAIPGPVAYGKGGTEPTVTDAAFALGYLDPAGFLDGRMAVDAAAARAAIASQVGAHLGFGETEAARAVLDILVARTVGALREITIERGLDPREFTLLAFGGAGPLIGPLVARELGLAATLVPRAPAAFSAFGMLMSDLEYEFAATALRPLTDDDLATLEPVFAELQEQAAAILEAQHVAPGQRRFTRTLDLRYQGQEHTLSVEIEPGASAQAAFGKFEDLHRTRHGHAMDSPGQILSVRLHAVGLQPKPGLPKLPGPPAAGPVPAQTRPAYDMATQDWTGFAIVNRDDLLPGHRLAGPAIIEEGTSTTVIYSDQSLAVDGYGHLLITPKDPT